MFTELVIAVSLYASASSPAPATPNEFSDSLQVPVPLENVQPVMELNDGIHLEVRYDLQKVGQVTIAVYTDDSGSGLGLVTVGETVAVELQFAEGLIASESVNFPALSPAQVLTVAASLMQVWHDDAVAEALAVATLDERDFKCTIAGNIAGAVSGVGVFAACELVLKNPVNCGKTGGGVWGYVAFHITNKCNGAQNH